MTSPWRTGLQIALAAVSILSCGGWTAHAAEPRLVVYVGTYTGPKSRGIYPFNFDPASGALTPAGDPTELANPSFLAPHPNSRFLYAVSEVSKVKDRPAGAVAAFAIDGKSARLTPLNQQTSGGTGPCQLTVDPSGRHLLVANYGSGSIEAVAIDTNGRLGGVEAFQQHAAADLKHQPPATPHAHCIALDPAGRFILVADLGLDRVFAYRLLADRFAANAAPATTLPKGAGPRHFVFHPHGPFLYLINELNSTIMEFRYDPDRGTLEALETVSTLPPGTTTPGNTGAEIAIDPSGRFLYGSNRGHDSIVLFAVNPDTGRLTYVADQPSGGKKPRNFAIDPTGNWLLAANQDSDNIVVFRIDSQTGRLTPAGEPVPIGNPACVTFLRLPSADAAAKP